MTRFRWFLLLTVLAMATIPFLLSFVDIGGGSTLDSPDGNYRLSTWGTMKNSRGGEYTVDLYQVDPPRRLRSVTAAVADDERTPVMRGGCKAHWDMANGTVDLLIDDQPEIRLHFPSDHPPPMQNGE